MAKPETPPPPVTEIVNDTHSLSIGPNDVLVVHCDASVVSSTVVNRITAIFSPYVGISRIIVLPKGMKLTVIKREAL